MKQKTRKKRKLSTPSRSCDCRTSKQQDPQFSIVFPARMLNAANRHAIDQFVDWYCSEPRLSFSKTVVTRYRMHLEPRRLAPGTINLRLGAVRRLAYEAADCGLLSAGLGAGIRRVKGVKKLGARQLVNRRPRPSSLAGPRSRPAQGQKRSGLTCSTSGLWAPAPRTRRADGKSSSTTRRALGNRRPSWEGWTRSNHPRTRMGAGFAGRE